jgi:hypothetical protein
VLALASNAEDYWTTQEIAEFRRPLEAAGLSDRREGEASRVDDRCRTHVSRRNYLAVGLGRERHQHVCPGRPYELPVLGIGHDAFDAEESSSSMDNVSLSGQRRCTRLSVIPDVHVGGQWNLFRAVVGTPERECCRYICQRCEHPAVDWLDSTIATNVIRERHRDDRMVRFADDDLESHPLMERDRQESAVTFSKRGFFFGHASH